MGEGRHPSFLCDYRKEFAIASDPEVISSSDLSVSLFLLPRRTLLWRLVLPSVSGSVLRGPAKPAFPAGAPAPAAGGARPLPVFSSLLLLPRPNGTATPFDAAAARPHLAHLQAAPAPASSAPASTSPAPAPACPASVSVHREQLPYDGVRVVELPCGLAVGSHVTVVARPRPARPEYDPKIAERKDGEAAVMVSQFMVELVGTKAVDGEAPPRILHFNPRIRGDYSRRPVIEMNSCYRMQWGQSQRCEGFASRPAEDTGELSTSLHRAPDLSAYLLFRCLSKKLFVSMFWLV